MRSAPSRSTFGPSSGQHDPVGRHTGVEQRVDETGQRLVRPLVLLERLAVAGADAEHEPLAVPAGDPVVGPGQRRRVGLPDVDDAGRHDQRAGRVEGPLGAGELGVGAAQPERAVAGRLHRRGDLGGEHPGAHPGAVPADLLANLGHVHRQRGPGRDVPGGRGHASRTCGRTMLKSQLFALRWRPPCPLATRSSSRRSGPRWASGTGLSPAVHPVDLSAHVLRALVERTGIDPAVVDDVIWGCVQQVGEQATTSAATRCSPPAGRSRCPAMTIDRQCGSSQQSVHFAAAGLISGQYDVVVAGGVESMSRVPMALLGRRRVGCPFGPLVAERYGGAAVQPGRRRRDDGRAVGPRPRPQLDEFSRGSHAKAAAAQDAGALRRQRSRRSRCRTGPASADGRGHPPRHHGEPRWPR